MTISWAKISEKIPGKNLLLIWYNSVAKAYIFMLYIETEPSLVSNSP